MRERKTITLLSNQILIFILQILLMILCIVLGIILALMLYSNELNIDTFMGMRLTDIMTVVIFYIVAIGGVLAYVSQNITNYMILFWNKLGIPTDLEFSHNSKKKKFRITNVKKILSKTKNIINLIGNIYISGSFNDTLQYVSITFSSIIPFDYIGVALISDDKNYIEAINGISIDSTIEINKKLAGHKVDINRTSLDSVINDGQPRVINDLDQYLKDKEINWYNKIILDEGIKSSITLPLFINGKVFGIVFFSSKKKNAYHKMHTDILDVVASTIAASLNKNILINDILLSSTIALAKITESRDNDTGDHIQRIKEYSRLIALFLSKEDKYKDIITEEYIDDIEKFSPLHDIGKVAIPDQILLKPGKLTKQEFEVMKTHVAFGAKVLREADSNIGTINGSFFAMGIDIAEGHHEKFDGTGYPYGKKGEEIPLSARIVALADVFDALTSKRTYKEAFAFEKAFEIIVRDSGTHFDPDIVQAFIKHKDEFSEKFKQFN